MINDSNFKSPGTELNRMMDRLGFADQIGDLYGAALDGAIGNNAGVARNLLDAYSPLSTGQLDALARSMSGAAFVSAPGMHFPSPALNVPGYTGIVPSLFPTPGQVQQNVTALLNRFSLSNFDAVIQQLSGGAMSANQNIPESLGKTFEQIIAQLEGKIEKKLDAEAQAAPVKKKKKKGGLGKLKKSLSKKMKSVTKFAKKTFQNTFKTLNQSFTGFFQALKKGDIFQMGRAFTGGLIGGPFSGFMMDNLMKIAGKKNPLEQVFKQFHGMLDLVGGLQKNQADLQRSLLNRFLR